MYTPMHGSVGMLIAAILIRCGVANPYLYLIPLGFCSHFVCDLYPEYYPVGGWYKKEGSLLKQLWNLLIDYYLLWLIIVLIIAFQINVLKTNKHGLMLLIGFILANLVDLTEAVYKAFNKGIKSFWFCHHGYFPFKVKKWQLGRMRYKTAIILEILINSALITFIYILLKGV